MDRLANILSTLKDLDLQSDIEELRAIQSRFGSTCDVFMGWSKKLKKNVAVKRFRLFLKEDEKFAKKLAKEIRIWTLLKHEFVLPFLGYYTEGEDAMPSLVSLWMGHGTVDEFMKRFSRGGEETRNMLCGIANGLSYLHSREVIHADLKSNNILISDDCKPLLADFGISTCLAFTKSTTTVSPSGTVRWMAIELFQVDSASSGHTPASDVWSFGMVAYELLSGDVPFSSKLDFLVPLLIINKSLPDEPANESRSPLFGHLWEMCKSCWNETPRQRPTSANLYEALVKISETPNASVSVIRTTPPNSLGRSPQVDRPHTKTPSLLGVTPALQAFSKDRTNMFDTSGSSCSFANSAAVLQSPDSSSTQLSKGQTNITAKSPSPSTFAGKMRAFLGQPERPPSELVVSHLPTYFPDTQPKVLRRTLRHISNMVTGGKRERARSIVSQGIGEQLPSSMRFSSSTIGSHVDQRTPVSPGRALSISPPPPLGPGKSSMTTNAPGTAELTEEPRSPLPSPDRQTSEPDRSSESKGRDIGTNIEVHEEPEILLGTTEGLVAAAGEESDEDEDNTLDDGGYGIAVESAPTNTNEDVEPIESTGDGERGIKWIKGALIGSGSFSRVYLGMDALSGLLMAVKQLHLPSDTGPNEERKRVLRVLKHEIDLLRDLQHENIAQYLDSSSDDQCLNIFLEYVPGGSVSTLLHNYGAFDERLCCHFVRQTLQGLSYLHDRDIIHRDIKGSNILVDNKGNIKISDFGMSKIEETLAKGGCNLEFFKGTVFWMAPEAIRQKSYTRKADIWSFGCLLIEMLTGERSWPTLTEFQAILKVGMNAKPQIPADISPEAEDFLNKTFEINIELRPSAKELLQHAWIVKAD